MKRIHILLTVLFLAVMALILKPYISTIIAPLRGRYTVQQRIAQYGPAARKRLRPYFKKCYIEYPPKKLVLVGLKEERLLQVYAKDNRSKWRCIHSYPILAASGNIGPKLKYGDCQVPEGIYRIVYLNPNSLYHLSLRLNYPNNFDSEMGRHDGRGNLGSDIMIHGSSVSVGCIAVGDQASEDLFVLASDTGMQNAKVILSPVDFRVRNLPPNHPSLPKWSGSLYAGIKSELSKLPDK